MVGEVQDSQILDQHHAAPLRLPQEIGRALRPCSSLVARTSYENQLLVQHTQAPPVGRPHLNVSVAFTQSAAWFLQSSERRGR